MKTKQVKKLLRKYCKWWIHWTGLGFWNVTVKFDRDTKPSSSGGYLCGCSEVNWEYLNATITLYPRPMKLLSKAEIEKIVIHELMHVFLNEMRAWDIEHEERCATQLQKAFSWVKGTRHA